MFGVDIRTDLSSLGMRENPSEGSTTEGVKFQ